MNAINVNPQSESALKAYAALQFPGSIDNFGTKTPIHLLMQQADSEHNLVLTDACDSDCDLDGAQFDYLGTIYDTVSELVKDRLGLKTDEDVAYQRFITQGIFEVKEVVYYVGRTSHTARKTLVTPKGQVYLAKNVAEGYKG